MKSCIDLPRLSRNLAFALALGSLAAPIAHAQHGTLSLGDIGQNHHCAVQQPAPGMGHSNRSCEQTHQTFLQQKLDNGYLPSKCPEGMPFRGLSQITCTDRTLANGVLGASYHATLCCGYARPVSGMPPQSYVAAAAPVFEAAGAVAAPQTAGLVWRVGSAMTGTSGATSRIQPWSFHAAPAGSCGVAGPTLSHQYLAMGAQWRGFHGGQAGELPLVISGINAPANWGNPAVHVPGNGVLMHPGPSGDCAVVRFHAPGTGMYTLSGSFYGAYSAQSTGGGDGVTPIIFHNGAPVGPTLGSTASAQRQPFHFAVHLQAHDRLDFAVSPNSNYFADSTVLVLAVRR